jgi:hypothetical protein
VRKTWQEILISTGSCRWQAAQPDDTDQEDRYRQAHEIRNLFGLLETGGKSQYKLLNALAEESIIDRDSRIIDYELYSPYTYLRCLAWEDENPSSSRCDSEQVRLGAQEKLSAYSCQLSELNMAPEPFYTSDQFIDLVRFEQRSKLDELPDD